ncbi:hypothetical protein N7676_19360 [Stenotrophomonas sp. GD03993]|uniref:hypothetical protein n=1 Tax=unclassified Stenotrophomonas TaxID=196198 RepID=UPI0018D28002|nr:MULTISPECIES: hypothetical protein [unclassified Stenotrophomonas]MBH1460533.1 hypothetical protein [Stenotrophomonas maltophilia]MDH0189131.1 hypothetical protein [Stenotrophomonas sp. GD04051]MDH0465965.1 hypothetical protein [Stenotrophomonas sp. GD03993]MDH0876615.1 hypothetical protein [Stenotrophomonas sp. GD03877]MDH2157375.1 hypothetical protein [Stenotrophomonas sp. GD03657]
MFFPRLQDANDAIEPFGMSLTRDGDGVVLEGDSTWRAWRAGSESPRFDTLGHFWAEWCWYVAFALENERQRSRFMDLFMDADLATQVSLLDALRSYEGRPRKEGNCVLSSLLAGPIITTECIPSDWSERLVQCIENEGEGAVFGGGKLLQAVGRRSPDALRIYRESL